ncbi:Alpha/Beta hydrolase protein [Mariannaea sp. PMI_226]|nr:Alpha/Beta hydrolase protein [Mariannaea sp. PMI_226]
MSECCFKGFLWKREPIGEERTIGNLHTYITGSNSDVAILLIHDMFGWTFPNTRILADMYAKEVDATVYVPDFFGNEVLSSEIIRDRSRWKELDLPAFEKRNSKEVREPEIFECAKALRLQYKRVGAAGFCFGGWAVFRLGAHENLVDCILTAHPTWLTKDEIEHVNVPTQILAPESDPVFTPELKEFANQVIPRIGVPYDYQYFPKVHHGFAIRGNPDSKDELKAMHRAKDAAVYWFRLWLHTI